MTTQPPSSSSIPQQDSDLTAPLLPSHANHVTSNAQSSSSASTSPEKANTLAATSINMFNTVVSGAAFGAALVASGVYQPSVIIGQLELKNWHMMQAFLTATGSSALFIHVLSKLRYTSQPPRQATTLRLFSTHDGNILGGALLGTGMALAGACPGTVLAQVGVGLKSGFYALDGAILAGLAWTGVLRPILKPCHPKAAQHPAPPPAPGQNGGGGGATGEEEEEKKLKLTVYEHLNTSRGAMLLVFEAVCAAAVAATVVLSPSSSASAKISPVLGGFLIGLSQLLSLLVRKNLLGASSSYEEVANYALWLFKGARTDARPSSFRNVVFAAGMAAGAWLLGKALPGFVEGAAVDVPPALSLSGGFLMVLGARIAGGCTSGHGISGMSLFSVSSFVTIGTALAVGVLTRSVVMPGLA